MEIEVKDIRRLDVKPGETLVMRFERPATTDQADAIRGYIRPYLPEGVKLLCLFGGPVELDVVADDAAPAQ